MKVLMFGWEFPPHISGGLGTACYGLTKSLKAIGNIDLTFIIPKAFGDEDSPGIKIMGANEIELSEEEIKKIGDLEKKGRYELKQQISAYCGPAEYERILTENQKKSESTLNQKSAGKLEFTGYYGSGLLDEINRYAVVASEIAKKEDHDVIHAHDWLTYPAGIEAKKRYGKPLVVHVHATEFDRCGEKYNEKVYAIEKRGMEVADKVIAVSEFTRNIIINRYRISPLKVVTIHNGVEPVKNNELRKLWKIGTDDKIVTYLGRITSQKGPQYFIEAAYKVLQRVNNVRFIMAGGGDLMEKMIPYAAKLHITDKFHFTGFLRGDDVYKMYTMSDLYVMPSVSEPFGISPLEAIQCNVPVIISKQSGVSEVLNHAIKIDFWDIDAMADAIYGVLHYKALSDLLRRNGKSEVDKLNWTNAAKKIRKVYNDLTSLTGS